MVVFENPWILDSRVKTQLDTGKTTDVFTRENLFQARLIKPIEPAEFVAAIS